MSQKTFRHGPMMVDRRGVFKTSAAMPGGTLLPADSKAEPAMEFRNVNTNSSPSSLKITDLRVGTVLQPSPCSIIRIDTNQGVYGLAEVRDGSSPTYALMLKSRILGHNPLQVDFISKRSCSLAETRGRLAA